MKRKRIKATGGHSSPTKAAATAQAKATLLLLDDKRGWKIKVHENVGWHWSLLLDLKHDDYVLRLYASNYNRFRTFSTLLGKGGGGEGILHDRGHPVFYHPDDAIRAQLSVVRVVAKKYIDVRNALEVCLFLGGKA